MTRPWPNAILLRTVLVFILSIPLASQDESQPYFSLSSGETFATGAEPFVQISGYDVDSIRIRVYRVNDPVQFMRQMGDPHQFGGAYQPPHGKLTLLERLHQWKRGLKRNIRYNLRQQFTESPSAHFESNRPGKLSHGSKATYFAEAPVLNQQQLVLSFLQPLTKKQNRWDSQKVKIPVRDKGVFLVEAVHQNLSAYTLLVVSDIALLAKTGRSHILYYVADRKTGEPLQNATITAMERDGKGIELKPNSNGVAEYNLQETPANDLRVVAMHGRDTAFSDLDSWLFSRRDASLAGIVYTDRPVYRPGDPMHFRAILRYQQSAGYKIPTGQTFAVQVNDPNGKTIYQKSLISNSNGIIHDDLTLEKDTGLGSYFIEVRSGETTTNGNFEVQEYKKPEYEVHVTPANRRILQAEKTQVTIDSRFYFGEPVAGAKVKYSVYRSRYWFPLWSNADDDSQSAADQPDDYSNNQQSDQSEGTLDTEGKLVISLPTEVSDNHSDTLYRIEAGVTDAAGREISGTGYVIASYGDFVTDVRPDRWFYQPGSKGSFTVEARDYDNHTVSVPVHLEVHRYDWHRRSLGETLAQSDGKTGPDGLATLNLELPSDGGDYRLIAKSPSAGRIVESSTYIWVAGTSESWGDGETAKTVLVVPDKKTYRAGDTAQIMIATGQDKTPVLVTVEGRDVRSHTLLRAKGGTAVFSYKVTRDDEPAFFISAQFFCDGELHQGTKRMKVPPTDHKLDIKLATDKPQYLPGQPATYAIDVKTADGKAAALTDLSLSVVDEAIYAIVKDSTPDLIDVFYGREENSVRTIDSLTYYFSGEAGTRRMQLASLRPRTRLAQLKPEQLVKPKVRKYFPDTTFWAADITTDSNGHAQAQFAFPDSLTTWRATARGSSGDDRYGVSVVKTVVRKNLILRLAVPRFFVQGDEVVISAIVHNYLQNDKQARVDVKLEGLDIVNGSATQDVSVPKRGEAKVDWRVKARNVRSAKISAEALTDEESDALELPLPINPPGVPITDPHSGSLTDSGSVRLSAAFPQAAVTGSRSLTIRLTPSVAGSVFSALEYLTSFPYGCVEQTMSSFLPDVIVMKTTHELNLKQPMDQKDLDQKISAGLERLYGYHHQDGGWGWWATDDSHPFMTAYVVAGLSLARSAGISVDNQALGTGANWIQDYFRTHSKIPADLKAYMAYALTVSGHDPSVLQPIYQNRAELSSYGLAFLGLSFEEAKDQRASEIAGMLEASAKRSATEASWPSTRDEMLDFSADITPEVTAYATKLLSHERPKSSLLPKAALWLVNHRNEGYWWSSTKETAMVIYGLADYIKASNELHPDSQVTVRVNGQTVGTASFNQSNLTTASTITLDESKLHPDTDEIQIETHGVGRTYYSVTAQHYSDAAKAENDGSIALNILRDYYRLEPGKDAGNIVYDLQPLSGPVAQGDVLAVRLTVTGSEWRYLLVEDPIPAGTEFLKDDKLYHLRSTPPWWQYWFTERENHDDHIAMFINYFWNSQKEYFYVLKVVNPGMFHVSPARVRPMYQHGYQATTASTVLEVK